MSADEEATDASSEDIPFEKLREETREVTDCYYGTERIEERKISELCQYCPNEDCPGAYQRNASHACITMEKWRRDRLTLEEAVAAKHRQHSRHERTDEFREWVFEMLAEELYIPDDCRYEARSELASFAAAVAKGNGAFEAREEFGATRGESIGHYVVDGVSDHLCQRIESQRNALVGRAEVPDAAIPVSRGETHTVDIIDIGREGDGIAKVEGYVLIVPEADLGETVTVTVKQTTESVAFTAVVSK